MSSRRQFLTLCALLNAGCGTVPVATLAAPDGLIAQLQRRFGLDSNQRGTHRDYSTQTVCPGAHLLERFPELKAAVKACRS